MRFDHKITKIKTQHRAKHLLGRLVKRCIRGQCERGADDGLQPPDVAGPQSLSTLISFMNEEKKY